jgi:hypothetical protein
LPTTEALKGRQLRYSESCRETMPNQCKGRTNR